MQRSPEFDKLAGLIDGIAIAMLATVEADGELRSRPMATQAMTADGDLLFFTRRDAPKVGEATHHPVNVVYADTKANTYVSVSGNAVLDTDKAEIAAHWKPELKAWFPDGVDDPQIALLRVRVTRAEYWDAPHGPIVRILELAKAATGAPVSFGDHGTVETPR
jgi:general stress protein 26